MEMNAAAYVKLRDLQRDRDDFKGYSKVRELGRLEGGTGRLQGVWRRVGEVAEVAEGGPRT